MMKSCLIGARGCVLLLLIFLVGTAWAQNEPPQGFEPEIAVGPEAMLIQATNLLEEGKSQESWDLLERICNDFAGQNWEAEARMHKAFILTTRRQTEAAEAMLASIVADFPQSEIALRARMNEVDFWFLRHPLAQRDSRSAVIEQYLDKLDELIAEAGGSSLRGESYRVVSPRSHLSDAEQLAILYELYNLGAARLSSATIVGQFSADTPDIESDKRAFQMLIRAIEFLPVALDLQMSQMLASDGRAIFGIMEPDRENLPPLVYDLQPSDGAQVSSLRPEISFRVTGGTVHEQMVHVGRLEFEVDGVEVPDLERRLKIDANLEEVDEPFLVFTVSYHPGEDLPLGQHTVRASVIKLGMSDHPTEVEWTFTITEASPPPPDDPTSDTLPATKDTTIYDRGPHKNEGANPRLLLKKVQGKPAHFLVGFDTANLNTNGLTKATLVLTIDSSQNVTGWGNGRQIRARRVLTEWAEGNGMSLELPNNQQTSGSGSGATWFSPVDANIANNQADSAVTWSGGMSFTAPSTAPTVTIKNHQSGEVAFEVTEDLLLGAPHGWLISRDQDVGSQVAFHSREAGAALAPRLVLEYGPTVAGNSHQSLPFGLPLLASMRTHPITTTSALWSEGQSRVGNLMAGNAWDANSRAVVTLKPLETSPEARPGLRQTLRQSPMLAFAGEQLVSSLVGPNPITQGIAGTAYRGWLELG